MNNVSINEREYIWEERWRPKTIDECILPKHLKDTFKAIAAKGDIGNMILTGTSGLGKTTIARALCDELGLEHIIINGSEDSGIEVLRGTIRSFASTVSLMGSGNGPKVVIIDEADYLNPQSTQPALRGFIEEFSANCRFIMTCNFKHKLIQQMHSRCPPIEFNTPKSELGQLSADFMKRLEYILTAEGITYERKIVASLIMKHAPDWRSVLNFAQLNSVSGVLSPLAIVDGISDQGIAELVGYLRNKDFKSMRNWVSNNSGMDGVVLYRKIFDNLNRFAVGSTIPSAVLIIADYSYKIGFVADKELNMVACLTELMSSVEWNKKPQ